MKRFAVHAVLVAGVAMCVGQARAQDEPSIVAQCETCHGPKGNSTSAKIPRLNGQQHEYLVARFKSFRDPTRQTPHATQNMWPVSGQYAAQLIPRLADYFANQTPTPSKPSGPLAAEGQKIYEQGAEGVPACRTCHGDQAGGRGQIPRLAGQHGEYLRTQLAAINMGMRVSEAMHPTAKNMSQEQMDAVVAYLAND
jgi:cytochrome c553